MVVLSRDFFFSSSLIKSCLLNQSKLEETSRHENQHAEMGDTNELMEFLSASLGATPDEIYQRLIDCDFTREDPGLAMFVVALLNALGREGLGNRSTEVVLMLVRDSRERSKSIDEMAPRRNVRTRLGS